MTRGKCSGCGRRRNIIMESHCRACVLEELHFRVAKANAPGASDLERQRALWYMETVTKATRVKGQLPLSLGTDVPPSQRGPDTI